MKEFEYINWIRSQQQSRSGGQNFPGVIVGPGDDCAVVNFPGELVITTDQCIDSLHFDVAKCGAFAAGRKVFARSLSDIAAMAATPLAAVATAAMPKNLKGGALDKFQRELYAGLSELAESFNCPIIGGDLSFGADALHLTVTMFGKAPAGGAVLRSGASAGELLLVTGALGQAWQSGRDLTFTPRVAEARVLIEKYAPTAMLDISDGLAGDVLHLCDESSVSVKIYADKLPLSAAAAGSSDPVMAALTDGEDYELLFTLAASDAERLIADKPFDAAVTVVGSVCDAAEGPQLIMPDATTRQLRDLKAFEHGG